MSKAFAQRTVKFINKVGTFTAYLQSSSGDLWQTYTLNGTTYTNIVPNYETLMPVLYFVCISSRTSGTSNLNGVPTWYFGDTKLNTGSVIDATISGKAASLYFDLVSPSSGQPYYGLRIKKNLVELTNGSSVSIKSIGELIISATGTTDTIQAQTSVSITPATANGIHISILDVTPVGGGVIGRSFTFTQEDQTITMKAQTYEGATLLDETAAQISANHLTYQWQKITNGEWTNISGATSQTLTISENDVMTYQQYRCAVSRSSELLGYGTANVMDATDPFVINPNPTPMDETIEDSGDTVSYTPKIVSRDSGTEQTSLTNQGFFFNYTNSQGVDITPSALASKACTGTGTSDHFITGGASSNYPVTYAMCQSNGDIIVSIETVADLKDY